MTRTRPTDAGGSGLLPPNAPFTPEVPEDFPFSDLFDGFYGDGSNSGGSSAPGSDPEADVPDFADMPLWSDFVDVTNPEPGSGGDGGSGGSPQAGLLGGIDPLVIAGGLAAAGLAYAAMRGDS